MLSIYPLLITAFVSFKYLLLVAICVVDLPTAYYPFGILQTFITSGHCVVDLPTANYPLGIFQTFINSGHCVVDLPTAYTRLVSSNIYY